MTPPPVAENRPPDASIDGRPATVPFGLTDAAGLTVAEVLPRLGSSASGMSATEAAERLASFGPNVLAEHRVTAWDVLWRQLRNPLLVLLLGAAGVSAGTGDVTDGGIIAAIVLLSVGLGFVNEYRSEQAVAALHAGIHHEALVWRDGAEQRLEVAGLVPGDIVGFGLGDLVPADVRLIEVDELECDEAVLTGESAAAVKTVEASSTDSAVDLPSCAFMGTVVRQGSGRGVVVATGSSTAFGRIAVGLGERQAETAFQVGLRNFSRLLVKVAAVLTTSIFVINLVFHRPVLDALLFSLAIAIGITPQLLPAIVSVSLSAGSRQLARKRVLVKRLVTIEDLGNIEVLFTDKTGTSHRRRHHVRQRPRRGGSAVDATAPARSALQRSDDDRVWSRGRERPRRRALGVELRHSPHCGARGPRRLPTPRPVALRPRTATHVRRRAGPGRRPAARDQGGTRGRARPLHPGVTRRPSTRSTACSHKAPGSSPSPPATPAR